MSVYARAATAALATRQALDLPSKIFDTTRIEEIMATSGASVLGTVLARFLPDSLTNNPMPHGKPWGERNSTNTNYYEDTPNTGVTRYYDWTISKTRCAPDGVEVDCLLANDQFPGPTIEANWGDWIEVKVHNNLTDEGTSIHWHGILQKEAQWMDGVPGYTQCPIAPDADFTYRFRADLYGTSWWHAHYSAQYGSGLVGPMIIYGPKNVDDDIDLGPIMLQDWFHSYYQDEIDGLFNEIPNAVVPRGDSNTINGKGYFPCSDTNMKCDDNAPVATFNFTSGKVHRLRLINPSSAATQKFTIDGHKFRVIATDFVEIEPYETDVITLGVGQRSDVLVYGSGAPTDAVYMRSYRPTTCALSNGNEEVLATIYYEDADRGEWPSTSPGPNAYDGYCGNDPLEDTVPFYPIPASEPSVTEILPVELKSNGTHLTWYMGGRTFRADYNDPMLLDVNEGNLEFDFMRNLHNYGNNKTLRFVIENTGPQPHPMHMHGHNIQIVAEGPCGDVGTVFRNVTGGAGVGPPQANPNGGQPEKRQALDLLGDNHRIMGEGGAGETLEHFGTCWDGTVTNPKNPARRDVAQLMPNSYIVLQWNQDNPGVWPFHCHIAWHLSAGFVWSVLEHPEELKGKVPDIMGQTCDNWDAWSETHRVNQISSN